MERSARRREGPEWSRLAEADHGTPWRRWGPYLSERQWGTVREDYSAAGSAWEYLPHDHARSRAYRWGEDGLAGFSDEEQRLCFALAFWNGVDPILKERIYGLTGNEGNHGEDAKEYWWYTDATPTASWLRWQYVYPQREFPYGDLLAENRRRGKLDMEYELLDTGVFDDDRYWDITVDYAKATAEDVCVRISVRNAGPDRATIHVLPTLWFRNTWSWAPEAGKPEIRVEDGGLLAEHPELGARHLAATPGGEAMFCENETNVGRLFGVQGPGYPKDGINDHVVRGAPTINPERRGTKAAIQYRLEVGPGETKEIRLRLGPEAGSLDADWERTMARRLAEADTFYAGIAPQGTSTEDAMIMRQAFSGLIWCKQTYLFDVQRWLNGDPNQPPPPAERRHGRNVDWQHVSAADVISMPDKWEYPWFATWDLAFHASAFVHIDPWFAKQQLLLTCREWYMHPNGALPAYEWSFGDVNPPVHPLAAIRVFETDGGTDYDFLERIFQKLLMNFTWWVNRKDQEGNNLFEGGFLGLDNIGPFDRSQPLPIAGTLEQADGTSWMAGYCLGMLYMSLILADHDPIYEDAAVKFVDHFTYIANSMNQSGIWDEQDGFYYDHIRYPDGHGEAIPVRSVVGLLPLSATAPVPRRMFDRMPDLIRHLHWLVANRPENAAAITTLGTVEGQKDGLLAIVGPDRLPRVLSRMLDESEFLSPYGIRAISRYHRDHPLVLQLGSQTFRIDYEPAESTTSLFGGNSNWRGPIWFPVNFLLVTGLRRYYAALGPDFKVEHPTGSGRYLPLIQIADDLAERLISIFRNDAQGRRPVFGGAERFQKDPAWHDRLLFYEYFHGDNGAGIGASHQTGWTALVADLIADRMGPVVAFLGQWADRATAQPAASAVGDGGQG